ncbi:MAG: OmpA family protein [Maribacter sp.]|nr:OmpA family protein [Maribacter sp.]
MKSYTPCILAMLVLATTPIQSQEDLQLSSKDSMVQSSWMLGVGYNFIDDSGDAFNDFTTIKDQWNAVAFPSRISIGRYFKSGIGIEAIGTYNNYKKGNIIDKQVNPEDISYFGLDTRLSYDINKLIGETAWFDPYVGVGIGYSDASNTPRGTYNAVIGFRTWFSDRWGLDLSSSGKWSFGNEASNHIQHAAGVVYQFGIEKGLSKKGEEKLALIQALEKEKQRIADSLANEQRVKDEAVLAERLAREKEKARLAAIEKAKLDAENQRKQKIRDAIDALGYVYFDFDSSYLNKPYKALLDKLALILKDNPSVTLKVGSHTDSRGPEKYNMWLSERRVEKTKAYLVSLGIGEDRLVTEAFGEEKLTNECDDNTRCPEEKHSVNRRSEFEVL